MSRGLGSPWRPLCCGEKQAPEMESYSSSAGGGSVVLSGFWSLYFFFFLLCWVFIAVCKFSCPMVYGILVH